MPPPPPLPAAAGDDSDDGDWEDVSEEEEEGGGVGRDEEMIGGAEEGEGFMVEEEEEEEEEGGGREEAAEAGGGPGGGGRGVGGGGGEGAREDRNEASRDDKLKATFGRLRSCSSAAGKSEANSSSNRTSEDRNCDFGTAVIWHGPVREPVKRFDSVGNDSTSPKLGKCRGPPEDVEDPESAVDGKGDWVQLELQRKVPIGCSGLSRDHAHFDCVGTTQNQDVSLPYDSLTVPDIYAAPCSEKDKQVDLQPADGMQMSSRCPKLNASSARLRSLSPGPELSERNKRVAIVCDFFAKGWCIRGDSCRFLHIKDNLNSTPELVRRHGTASSCIEEAAHDEGRNDDFDFSKSPGLPKHRASSVANNSALCSGSSLEQIQSQVVREKESVHQIHSIAVSKPRGVEDLLFSTPTDSHQLPLFKHHDGHMSADMDKGGDLQERSWSADDYRMHASKLSSGGSGSMRDYWLPPLSGSLRSFDLGQDKQTSFHASISEDQVTYQRKFIGDSSPIISHALNSSVKYPLTTAILPSQNTSRLTGSSRIFDTFSEVSNPLPAQSILDVDNAGHRSSSLLGSSSDLAGSDPGNLSRANISADSLPWFGNRRRFSSYDWEPSEPFRSSFLITPTTISSPGSKCDPFRDSIEQHETRNESFRLSFSSQRASVLNKAEQLVHSDSKRNLVEERVNNSYSSSHHRFNEHGLDEGSYLHGKDVNGSAVETAENSVVDSQTENDMSKENDQQSDHAKDSSHIGGSSMDLGSALGSDVAGHKKDLLSDKVRQDIEMDVTQKKAADVNQESKALRHFRVALIDYVKELLKPTWQGGRLSKDAHNLIVKKAVDKVLTTLQPQQIPPNPESIKHFLSFSQLKLTKLVEGYVDKHGKD
ncbi:protein FRIGIDA-ESSENTIAL 1 [Syzygium oleosum]|uniref:protein FRIGIDA-ESSENTIAL 1 n=1 Tax=Syzygium oleosum TaxID=219896 RepID=UPI0024B8EC0F|nr:protein FRIGIDA-ESSENTIAL 1 [Syzygium oleosum]